MEIKKNAEELKLKRSLECEHKEEEELVETNHHHVLLKEQTTWN